MIEIKNLLKNYDNICAVNNISLTVEKGDVYGFIGPNGAGKTTTIKMLATILEPTSGDAFIDGYSVIEHPNKIRKLIGFMPDEYGLYSNVLIEEYLEFFAGIYGIRRRDRKRIISEVMELTDLNKIKGRLTNELSRGMQQRVVFSKTLLHNPAVLILDEPASGLDPRARIEFRMMLKELRNLGKTIFISSHILTELADICNKVCIIEKGKIVASGKIEDIQKQIKNAFKVKIKLKENASKAIECLKNFQFENISQENDYLIIIHRYEEDFVSEIVRKLVLADFKIISVEPEKETLEDLFMKLTKGEVA